MVLTFESVGEQCNRRLHVTSDMAAASALLPQGAYTTFRTYRGDRVVRLEQHLCRLEETATMLNMRGTLDIQSVKRCLSRVIQDTGYDESRLRLTYAPPRLFVSIEPFKPYPAAYYDEGVACVTVMIHRSNPHAKSTTFIPSAGDAYRGLPNGIHEGLILSDEGLVLEGLSSSFIAILNGVLHSEQEQALVGVTQSLVLEVTRSIAPEVSQSDHAVRLLDIPHVTECFITSVSREIMPVIQIDDLRIGAGQPGPLTCRLIQGLHNLIEREAQSLTT
jgi:branched-chain amino acid aminotransferase